MQNETNEEHLATAAAERQAESRARGQREAQPDPEARGVSPEQQAAAQAAGQAGLAGPSELPDAQTEAEMGTDPLRDPGVAGSPAVRSEDEEPPEPDGSPPDAQAEAEMGIDPVDGSPAEPNSTVRAPIPRAGESTPPIVMTPFPAGTPATQIKRVNIRPGVNAIKVPSGAAFLGCGSSYGAPMVAWFQGDPNNQPEKIELHVLRPNDWFEPGTLHFLGAYADDDGDPFFAYSPLKIKRA